MPRKELPFPPDWVQRISDLRYDGDRPILVFAPYGKFHEYKKKLAEKNGLKFYSQHFLYPESFFVDNGNNDEIRYYNTMDLFKCRTRLEYAKIVFYRPELTLEEMCWIIHYHFWIGEGHFVQLGLAEEGTLREYQFILPHFLYQYPEEEKSMEEIAQIWRDPGINK